jgi:hypothetical protein
MNHLKVLEKQDQLDPKINRWNEIIKIWVEINEIQVKMKQLVLENISH